MNMKHLVTIAVAAVLACAAANVNAQSIVMSGSSGIFLELGQASATQPLTSPAILNCGWSDGGSAGKHFTLTDTRPAELGDPDLVDSGEQGWVTWTINAGTCSGTTSSTLINVNVDLSVDSSVGNRCFFANPSCEVTTSAVGGSGTGCTAGSGDIDSATFTETTCLPTAVTNLMSGGASLSINGSATDVRPEDTLFATMRGFQTCGTPMVTGSQYMGVGYQTQPSGFTHSAGLVGTQIKNGGENGAGSGPFNLGLFALEGNDPFATAAGTTKTVPAFTVIEVGAVPVVVFVNPEDDGGFGSLQVSNIDRGVLSGYLDGSFQRVTDLVPQAYAAGTGESFTFVREFLSGTYNTTEFNIPDSVQNQSSQDVGLASVDSTTGLPPLECTAIGGTTNNGGALADGSSQFSGTFYRVRTIGTGSMVSAVEALSDSLGYAFWSAANFSSATSTNAKYLTVDGIDPLQEVWSDGLVPVKGNLANVTLSHVRDGSYPIWSILRVICGTNCTAVGKLVTSAADFVGPEQPDFIPASTLTLVRSHFSPPGVLYGNSAKCTELSAGPPAFWSCPKNMSNGNTTAGETAEAGGDVGGVVYTLQADGDFSSDSGNGVGEVSHRN